MTSDHDSTAHRGPLSGIRVLELAQAAQGPIAGALLAFLGADVVKLEPASGDRGRGPGPAGTGPGGRVEPAGGFLWRLCNPNKHSAVVDLREESHRARFRELIAESDAFITNFMEEALHEFGADRDSVLAIKPDIVYGRTGGFGYKGPLANDPCQDTVGMAYAGMMDVCAEEDGGLNYPQYAISDILSGTMLAFGVVTGLLARERLGHGLAVNTSQLQTLMWTQLCNIASGASLGQFYPRHDSLRPRTPLLNYHQAGDGLWLAMGLIRQGEWETLMALIGHSEAASDPRFSPANRAAHSEEITALIGAALKARPRDEWVEMMRAAKLIVAKVNRIKELLDDEQVRANDFILELEDGFKMVAMPFTVEGYDLPRRPAPPLGSWDRAS